MDLSHYRITFTCFRHGHVLNIGSRAILQLDHLTIHDLSIWKGSFGIMLNIGSGTISKSDSLQADCVHALHLISIWQKSWKINVWDGKTHTAEASWYMTTGARDSSDGGDWPATVTASVRQRVTGCPSASWNSAIACDSRLIWAKSML